MDSLEYEEKFKKSHILCDFFMDLQKLFKKENNEF